MPTPTITPTPSTTPIVCGIGITDVSYYYTDCCGNFISVRKNLTPGSTVEYDYTKPNFGITKLNVPTSNICPTPTQTPSNSPTPTSEVTPSVTPTNTTTPTLTSTPTQTPSNSAVYRLKNDCDTFTLFDMGLECYTIYSPSTNTSTDGILSIRVTGGTSPYSFYWGGGQRTQTIYGLPPGSYNVTVVDYYGDYTASTICTLFGPKAPATPTQTPTQTVTPSPTWPYLCLYIVYPTQIFGPYTFIPSGDNDGKPAWYSGTLNLLWIQANGRWEIQNWTDTSGIPVSYDTSNVPLASWQMAGARLLPTSISMTQGTCGEPPLIANVTTTNTTCDVGVNCNGSITVATMGGVPPYSYSINNGVTYQSSNIFNGLCSNTYTLITQDSNSNSYTQSVTVNSDNSFTTYRASVVIDRIERIGDSTQIAYWHIDITPSLPLNVRFQCDLEINSTQEINEPGTGTITSTSVVSKGNITLPLRTSTNTTTIPRPNCSPYNTQNTFITETCTINIISGESITGTSTSVLTITNQQVGQNGCSTELNQDILISLSNTNIKGCECCDLIAVETKVGITNHQISQ